MSAANAITANLRLRLTEVYGRRAFVQRINVINAEVIGRGGKLRRVKSAEDGTADLLGAVCSIPLALEIKAGRDKQSEAQINFQDAWERAGGAYIIARDVDECMREIEAVLARAQRL